MKKRIKITLMTLLILIVGMVVVGIISSNHVNAVPPCANCSSTSNMDTIDAHTFICKTCGKTTTTEHSWTGIASADSTTHTPKCSICGQIGSPVNHTWGSYSDGGDGYHYRRCTVCSTADTTITAHRKRYTRLNDNQHSSACQDCNYISTDAHDWTTAYDDAGHTKTCKYCPASITKEHTSTYINTRVNNHTRGCTGCGFSKIEDHDYSDNYISVGDTNHSVYCECGQSSTEAHQKTGVDNGDGNHTITCLGCDYIVTGPHGNLERTYDDNTHTKKCSECNYSTTEDHNNTYLNSNVNNHTRGCTGCNFSKIEDHVWGNYININDTNHSTYCECGQSTTEAHKKTVIDNEDGESHSVACSECNYTNSKEHHDWVMTYDDENHTVTCSMCCFTIVEPHTRGKWYRNETGECVFDCSVCDFQKVVPHEFKIVPNYQQIDGKHTKLCDCGESVEEECAGGEIHNSNGGFCDDCGERISVEHESFIRKKNYSYLDIEWHKTVVYCTYPGCDWENEIKEEHYGGSDHYTTGVCGGCKEVYADHTMELYYYGDGIDSHLVILRCMYRHCKTEIKYSKEVCTDILGHAEGGVCKFCGEQRVVHGNHGGSFAGFGDITPTHHTRYVYCSADGCEEVYRYGVESHVGGNFIDNENGTHVTKCVDCEYVITEEHNYGVDGEFGTELSASTYSRRLGTPAVDVSCTVCGVLASAAENGCDHTYEEKSNETQHWKECTKCGYYERGSLEAHAYGEYTDNGDGTHSATCTGCEYKLTKKHYFENGICIECNEQASQECRHQYILKDNETEHWLECSKCSEKLFDISGKHIFEKYINNNDGTHTARCEICNYGMKEEHSEDCDKCETLLQPDTENDDENNDNSSSQIMEIQIITMYVMISQMLIKMTQLQIKKYQKQVKVELL